jgi:hypothetical protein
MKRAYVVEQGVNPSSDFFVIPKLISMGYKVTRCCHDELSSSPANNSAVETAIRSAACCFRAIVRAFFRSSSASFRPARLD